MLIFASVGFHLFVLDISPPPFHPFRWFSVYTMRWAYQKRNIFKISPPPLSLSSLALWGTPSGWQLSPVSARILVKQWNPVGGCEAWIKLWPGLTDWLFTFVTSSLAYSSQAHTHAHAPANTHTHTHTDRHQQTPWAGNGSIRIGGNVRGWNMCSRTWGASACSSLSPMNRVTLLGVYHRFLYGKI